MAIVFAITRGNSPTTSSSSSESPNASLSASASPSQSPGPVTPRSTPPGTPGPIPSSAIGTSAEVKTPPPPANRTETPAPEAGLWRVEGYVVDSDGKPLENVCIVIGPLGCKPFSPHTDERGYWFIDVAEGHTTFDFYFELPGHQTVWWRTIPEGPTRFNVILANG